MVNLLPITALFVAIIGLRDRKNIKRFSVHIKSTNDIVSFEEKLADQIDILFDGNKVENVHLTVMNIFNSGNQSILFEDFKNNVTFDFGWDASILSVSVVETEPSSLDPRFLINPRTVELLPLLLNGGDNFTVNFLVSNCDPDAFEVHGRIVGVKDIKLESEVLGVTKNTGWNLTAIITIIGVILLGASALLSQIPGFEMDPNVIELAKFAFYIGIGRATMPHEGDT